MSESSSSSITRCTCCRDEFPSDVAYDDPDLEGDVCPSCKISLIAVEKGMLEAGFSGVTHNPEHEK